MNTEKEMDQLRAAYFVNAPEAFAAVAAHVQEVFDIIHKYADRKDYDVTKSGFNAICTIVVRYLEMRSGTYLPASPFLQTEPLSNDPFFNDVLELLATVQQLATKNADLELSRQILKCHSVIAANALNVRYLANPQNDYNHTMLATGYMVQNVEPAIKAGLTDIGMEACRELRTIGLLLIKKKATTDFNIVIDHLYKIGLLGLQTNTLIVASVFEAYGVLLRGQVFGGWDLFSMKTILDQARIITQVYHNVKELHGHTNLDLGFTLGPLVDAAKQTALPNTYIAALQRLASVETPQKDKENLRRQLLHLSEDLWRFYDELAKIAAEKESFLIFFIANNLDSLIRALLAWITSPIIDDEFNKEKLLKNINWLLSDYWRIYKYHKHITAHFQYQILDYLIGLAALFKNANLMEQYRSVISVMLDIAGIFLEKEKDSQGFEAVRIAERAVTLAIGQDEITKAYALDYLKRNLWAQLKTRHPEHVELFFHELLEITHKGYGSMPDIEDQLHMSLTKEQVEGFVERARRDLA